MQTKQDKTIEHRIAIIWFVLGIDKVFKL